MDRPPSSYHLPNLDAVRFIAACLVILGHLDTALLYNGHIPKRNPLPIFNFSSLAVVLFFVLSGFLITYLMLRERERNEIFVRRFYLKRALRIWPVYYLVIILAFGFFNRSSPFAWSKVTDVVDVMKHPLLSPLLLLLISPNIVLLFTGGLGYANPAWSIGVEEQFYLIWPWIMRSTRPLFYILSIILCLYLLSNGIIVGLMGRLHVPPGSGVFLFFAYLSKFFTFDYSFRIDAMAIGALGAFAAYRRSSFLPVIFSRSFQLVLYAAGAILFVLPGVVPYQFYSVVFVLIIMNLALNPATVLRLESRFMNYGGRISYGMYMYHCFLLMPIVNTCRNVLHLPVTWLTQVAMGGISILASMAVAGISYRFYERYFLRIKDRVNNAGSRRIVPEKEPDGMKPVQ